MLLTFDKSLLQKRWRAVLLYGLAHVPNRCVIFAIFHCWCEFLSNGIICWCDTNNIFRICWRDIYITIRICWRDVNITVHIVIRIGWRDRSNSHTWLSRHHSNLLTFTWSYMSNGMMLWNRLGRSGSRRRRQSIPTDENVNIKDPVAMEVFFCTSCKSCSRCLLTVCVQPFCRVSVVWRSIYLKVFWSIYTNYS